MRRLEALAAGCALLALSARGLCTGEQPTVASAFQPGEEGVWIFESDGVRIGHHASRYIGQDELAGARAHHFQGSYRLKAPQLGDVTVLSTADLWTDDHGHPVRFVQQALVGESYSRVELAVAGKDSTAVVVQGPKPRELKVDVDPAAFLLANNFVSHLEILLALLPPGEDAKVELFSGNTLQGLGYTLKAQGSFEDLAAGKPVKGEVYDDSLGERLRFAAGRLVDVEIAAQKLVIRRTTERMEPVVIHPPEIRRGAAAFDSEDVTIRRGDAVIAGTITRKKGVVGRQPAVFFVSGSGPQDRNGFSSGLDLGTHEILDHLTARGFVVLRVDDRSAGESSALPPNATFLDLVADARACVGFLAGREDVDPARIALIGHSEGAQTVPILAAERPAVAAIVLMAPPGRSVIEVIADQNRLALEKQGLAADELELQMKAVRALLAKLVSDAPIDAATASDEERAALASRAWLQSHARQDPVANIRQVKCPVLIVHGAKDFQVSAEKDAGALEAALTAARHPDHELRVFPGLDHLFKLAPGERSELADYWKRRPVDAGVLDLLATWLGARLAPGGG